MENGVGFYDFGFGNETGYYDVTKTKDGVPCNELEGSERAAWKEVEGTIRDPTDVCYIGTYATDAFIGRAQKVHLLCVWSFCACSSCLFCFCLRIFCVFFVHLFVYFFFSFCVCVFFSCVLCVYVLLVCILFCVLCKFSCFLCPTKHTLVRL